MGQELRLMVPRNVWADEWAFTRWLELHAITGFFWEVCRYGDLIVIEVID